MKNFFRKFNLREFRSKYRHAVNIIAVIVVFATTYALILPAITLELDKANILPGINVSEVTTEKQETVVESESATQVIETTTQVTDATASEESIAVSKAIIETVSDATSTETKVIENKVAETKAVENKVVEKKLITDARELVHRGNDYEVIAKIDASAQMPEGVALKVKELEGDVYKARYAKAREVLGARGLSFARFFDISFDYEGKEVQPAAPVSIQIKTDHNFELKEETKVEAVHFKSANDVEIVSGVETNEHDNLVSEVSFSAASFSDYGIIGADYYKVTFVSLDSNGNEQTLLSLIDKKDGAKIETLPEPPFREGYRFVGWRDKDTQADVTADTVITKDMTVEAKFSSISIYKVTVQYYYKNVTSNQEVVFETDIYDLEAKDTPYRITTPTSTEVKAGQESGLEKDTIYYTSRPVVEIKAEDLATNDAADGTVDNTFTVKVVYIPYNAEYTVHYKLKDLTGSGYTDIETSKAYGVIGSTIRPEVRNYAYANFEKVDSLELTQNNGQSVNVYYTRKEYTLSYNTNGGDYIAPQTSLYNAKVALTTKVPTKTGYTFDGWYDNANLTGTGITGQVTLDKNKTLYAKWKAAPVKYIVKYYKEQYNDETNSIDTVYVTEVDKEALTDSTVQANSNLLSNTDRSQYHLTAQYGIEVDTGKNATSSVVIKADGTSVLNVYYKLIRYTLIFDLGPDETESVRPWQKYNIIGELRKNNKTYRGRDYRISNVVVGQNILNQWPSGTEVYKKRALLPNTYYSDYKDIKFKGWKLSGINGLLVTKQAKLTLEMIGSASINHEIEPLAQWSKSLRQVTVDYFLQSADNPTDYIRSDYGQTLSVERFSDFDAKEIVGYINLPTPPSGRQGHSDVYSISGGVTLYNHYRFYYDRETFTITYRYVSGKVVSELKEIPKVRFGQNISSTQYNYVPTSRPEGIDSDYTWEGWYTSPDLKTKYVFNKMPSNNLSLYAKWVAPNRTVSFDLNGGEGEVPKTQTVEKKKTATAVSDPTRTHYDFDGWFTAKEGGERYVWSKPVTENITLYARWKPQPLKYTVRYLDVATNAPLAADKVIESPALELNQVIKENALAITGYRPDASNKTLNLAYANNEIIFYYSDRTAKIPYTVRYLLKDDDTDDSNNRVLAPEEHLESDANMITAKVKAKKVEGEYYPTDDVLSLVLTSNSANNIITFYYLPYRFAKITVNYLDMDDKAIAGQTPLEVYKKIGDSYLLDGKEIAGYTFANSKDNENNVDKRVYRITKSGEWTINLYYKKNISLQANPKEKVYDGEPLTLTDVNDLNPNYTSDLAPGDQLTEVAFKGSQTEVGTSQATPKEAVIKDQNGKDHTYYYKITYLEGPLTVTKQPIKVYIVGQTVEKVYDGKETSIDYKVEKIEDDSKRYKESSISYIGTETSLTKKDVGTYTLDLQGKFTNKDNNFDVTFITTDGKIVITKRTLKLVSDSADKAYDGSELKDSDVTVKVPEGSNYDGFVDGEGVDYTDFEGLTKPGKKPNSFAYKAKDGTTLDNYDITTEFGELIVYETLNITKSDENWTPLAGGQFELTKWDGSNWATYEGVTTIDIPSVDGIRIPVGLKPGTYRLKETAAPDGYIVLESDVYFTVVEVPATQDNMPSTFEFKVTDGTGNALTADVRAKEVPAPEKADYSRRLLIANEKGKALPHTGGGGRQVFFIAGGFLMGFSLLGHKWITLNRQRKS